MVKKSSFLEKLFARKKGAQQKPSVAERGRVTPAATRARVSPASGADRGATQSRVSKPRVVEPQKASPSSARVDASAKSNKPAPQDPGRAGAKPSPQSGSVKPAASKPATMAPVERAAQTGVRVDGKIGDAHDKVQASNRAPAPAPSSGVSRILGGKSREDAAHALADGFRELGSLLHGIHERMDAQGQQSTELNKNFVGLPDMAQAQVTFMAKVSEQLVEQREKTGELLDKLSGLPDLLEGIHKTLERTAAVEERTEKNLRDFRTTMDRIHTSIGELSSQNTAAMAKATESLERTNTRTTQAFEESQQKAYTTFKQAQEQGLTELGKVVERTSRSNRRVTLMLAALCTAVVVMTIVILQR